MQYLSKSPSPGAKMKTLLLSLLVALSIPCHTALAASNLLQVARTDTRQSTHIYLTFDALPVHSVTLRERRLDITLEKTRPANNLKYFAADPRIIKILPITNADRTVVSLFFRHKPQEIKTEIIKEEKLIIEILIGSQSSQADYIVSRNLKDITPLNGKTKTWPNPLQDSPYAQNWRQFFSNYESPFSYSVPIHYTTPPFPLIDLLPSPNKNNARILPPEITELANQGSWEEMQPILHDLLKATTDIEQQKMLALTLGEILMRNDKFPEAYQQLSALAKQYAEEPVGLFSKFLLFLLQAQHLDNYSASPEFQEMEKALGPNSPLLPHLVLFEAETALAANQFKKAQQLLNRPDIAFPAETQKIKDLRQADIYVGLQQPLKAYVAYHLLKDTAPLNTYRDSLKGYCETLYLHKKFSEAGDCYTRLTPLVEDMDASGLINFRKAMAGMKADPESPNVEVFSLIEQAFPETEAGFRAALKKTDLKFLADESWGEEAIHSYQALAQKAVLRPLAAEAIFKEALVNKLLGRNDRAIALLMQFLREFQTGELRQTAQALLIDILPAEIKRLVEARKFPEALVLAKENKEVFQKNWLDIKILGDLAFSYRQIGLHNHAKEMYLYIMDIVKVDQREQYFLPLLETVDEQGDRKLVEQLASRYLNTYPQGKDRDAILILRLNALLIEGKLTQAQALLPSPLPKDEIHQLIAASLSFQNDNYTDTLNYLQNINEEKRASSPETLFMYGESLFQTGDRQGAEKAFVALQGKNFHSEQVHYRLAQIELGKGNTEKALKLFRIIVDKGENSLWRRYAEKELEYVEAAGRLQRRLEN